MRLKDQRRRRIVSAPAAPSTARSDHSRSETSTLDVFGSAPVVGVLVGAAVAVAEADGAAVGVGVGAAVGVGVGVAVGTGVALAVAVGVVVAEGLTVGVGVTQTKLTLTELVTGVSSSVTTVTTVKELGTGAVVVDAVSVNIPDAFVVTSGVPVTATGRGVNRVNFS